MKPKAFKRQTIKLAVHPNMSLADLERFGTAKALVLGNFAVHLQEIGLWIKER